MVSWELVPRGATDARCGGACLLVLLLGNCRWPRLGPGVHWARDVVSITFLADICRACDLAASLRPGIVASLDRCIVRSLHHDAVAWTG